MNSSNKMNNVLLVLLSASVIATFGTIIFHLVDTSYETETAMRAKADESKFFEGVYVRDETVLTYSDTGAISYQVPDGGKIAVNDVIAEIYPDESTIEKKQWQPQNNSLWNPAAHIRSLSAREPFLLHSKFLI